jgi:hypothetical protein
MSTKTLPSTAVHRFHASIALKMLSNCKDSADLIELLREVDASHRQSGQKAVPGT